MKKKWLAMVSAAVMCLSAIPIAGTAASDGENTDDIALDWVPGSFSEALEFENKYGATHIEDGVVCLVFSESTHESYSYEVVPTTDVMNELAHETYYSDDSNWFKYEVVVYKPFASGSFDVDLNRTFQTSTIAESSYDFFVDVNGTISETDIYSWLPDCITEYNDFKNKNGTVSVHDNYIAYCADINYDCGLSLVMEQNGSAEIEQTVKSDCTENTADIPAPGGVTSHSVTVYQPVSDGTVDVIWKIGQEWNLEDSTISTVEKSYEISGGGSVITEISTVPAANTQRVSVVDYDTGKPIHTDDCQVYSVSFRTGYEVEYIMTDGTFAWGTKWGPVSEWDYNVQNPYVIDTSEEFAGFGVAGYEVTDIELPGGYFMYDCLEVTEYDNNSADIKIRLKKSVRGDVSGDGSFNVADLVLLHSWMNNVPGTKISDCNAADFNNDGLINVFDVCLMRRELIQKK